MQSKRSFITVFALAALTAMPLAACANEIEQSPFDSPLPWHGKTSAYERLEYSVEIFDTSKGDNDKARVKIGDGTLTFTLEENAERSDYTALDMNFSVTYDSSDNAGDDKGLTDIVASRVVFEPKSMAAKSMTKTATLAPRVGKERLSYRLSADYFDTHKATFLYTDQANATEKTRELSVNAVRDNEMLFYLARAQNIAADSATNFKTVNIFDTFNSGKLTEYTVSVRGVAETDAYIGDFVKDYGVEAVTPASTGETVYPVKCISTNIVINAAKHGPAYIVHYAKNAFVVGTAQYKKIPVKIEYPSYTGNTPYRRAVYTLKSCAFAK